MTVTEIDANSQRVRLMRELTEQIGVMLGGSAPMTRAAEQHLDQLHDARLLCWGEVHRPGLVRDFYDAGASMHLARDPGARASDDQAYRQLRGRLERAVAEHTEELRGAGHGGDVWDLSYAAVDRDHRAAVDPPSRVTGHPGAERSTDHPGPPTRCPPRRARDDVQEVTIPAITA